MGRVWLYGHWLSENLGDRYQARTIVNYLSGRIDLDELFFVNFFPDPHPMSVVINDITYPVYAPEDVVNDEVNLIILVTGSVDRNASYMNWLPKYLAHAELREVIIWGGFSNVSSPIEFRRGLEVLADPRIIFWARSWQDLRFYRKMFPSHRCCLAGDPIGAGVIGRSIKPKLDGFRVVIISIHAWEHTHKDWTNLIHPEDHLISIDPNSDHPLEKTFPQIKFITNYDDFVESLRGASHVISGRLHGGLIASLLGLPTTIINIDDAPSGTGSFKFDAVANHGAGHNKGLCECIPAHRLAHLGGPPKINHKECQEFLELTQESLITIYRRIREITGIH